MKGTKESLRGGDSNKTKWQQVLILSLTLLSAEASYANPVVDNVESGNVSIQQTSTTTQINQSSQDAIINWQSFNIGAGESTHFEQPAGGVALNRINPNQGASQIFGSLTATGRIILVNQAGIFFGPGSHVDVGGLIASTSNISSANFLAGRYEFDQPSSAPASIINKGTIIAKENGLVALMGSNVTNEGVIQARAGSVVLASGNKFTVDLYGDQLINFVVNEAASGAALDENGNQMKDGVRNSGTILADGGAVLMTAKSAKNVVDHVINMDGVVEANNIQNVNGEIILAGDDDGIVRVSGKIESKGIAAKGGKVKIMGKKILVDRGADINVSGDKGGGEILIGGDYKGGTPVSIFNGRQTLANAAAVVVMPETSLIADAYSEGNGGKIIVWADDLTKAYGKISARGGELSGNGGFIETSGKNYLDVNGIYIDTRAPTGAAGMWLLDPRNVTISSGATTGGAYDGGSPTNTFTPTSDDAVVNVSTLVTNLNSTNVTITTGSTGTQDGDITVSNAIQWASNKTLTLQAADDIFINAAITNTNTGDFGALVLTPNTGATDGIATIAANLGDSTNRLGSVTINGVARFTGGSVTTSGAQTYAGNVKLASDTTLTTQNSAMTFSGNIGDETSGAHTLNISTGSGDVTFNGTIGLIDSYATLVSALSNQRVYWRFDDGSGTSAADSSGNNFTGTISGASFTDNVNFSDLVYSLNFGGAGYEYYNVAPVSTATNNMTMSAWIRWDGTDGQQSIFYNGTSNNSGYGFYVYNGETKIKVLLGGVATLTSSLDYSVDSWMHLVAVRDAGTWKLYVNGVLDSGLTSDAGGLTVAPNAPTTGTFVSTAFVLGAEKFNGLVDEAFIVNSAVDATTVASLYQAGVGAALGSLSISNTGNVTINDVYSDKGTGTGNITFSGTGNVRVGSGSLIDTEQGNNGSAGSIDFGNKTLSSLGGTAFDLTMNSSTYSTSSSGGNISVGSHDNSGGSYINNLVVQATQSGGGSAGAITLSGASTQTAGNQTYTGNVTLSPSGSSVSLTGGQITFSGTVDGSKDFTISNSGTSSVAGAMSNLTSFTKAGAGTLTLSGANTYTGATTINAGQLTLTGSLSSSTALSLANVASAIFDASGIGTAGLTLASLSGGGTTGGNVVLGAKALTVGDSSNTSYGGVISGTGASLTKQGTGSLTLSNANTYTAGTTINAGTLAAALNSALSTGAVSVASGGTLNLNNVTLSNNVTLTGSGVSSAGALTGTGTSQMNGTITFGGNTTFGASSASDTLTIGTALNGAIDLTFAGSGTIALSSTVGGTTPLNSLTASTQTTLNGGSVKTTGSQSYSGNVSLGANTTLETTGSGSISLTGAVLGSGRNLILTGSSSNNAFTVSGALTLNDLTINGVGGTDSLQTNNSNQTWNMTSLYGGTVSGVVAGTMTYSNIQNLASGSGNDSFLLSTASQNGSINAGGGTNSLTVPNKSNNIITVDGYGFGSVNDPVSFSNFTNFYGQGTTTVNFTVPVLTVNPVTGEVTMSQGTLNFFNVNQINATVTEAIVLPSNTYTAIIMATTPPTSSNQSLYQAEASGNTSLIDNGDSTSSSTSSPTLPQAVPVSNNLADITTQQNQIDLQMNDISINLSCGG